ncbi:MAG: BldC family transcriptional regulator [Actinomycetota bacterium]|nr:BldC family transcriptional regulator [Actinomycetota bacterium]
MELVTDSELLTPSEVARLFGVNPKTVTRWAEAGKLHAVWTIGGHRRYRAAEVYSLLEGNSPARSGVQEPAAME